MEKIRITSGNYRGREIATPGAGTHPMGAREKLALFNMLTGNLEGNMVLDAYAGSGALGIEALSRGAAEVVFVEKSSKACRIIRENLKSLGVEGTILAGDVANFETEQRFDVILADPPYDKFDLKGVVKLAGFLKPDGILVLSHPGEAPEIPGLKLLKSHKYAGAHISVYAMR